MQSYTTKQLLALLVALLEMSVIATLFKQFSVQTLYQKYPKLVKRWSRTSGICVNIEKTFSGYKDAGWLLCDLFQNCPSGTSSRVVPVLSTNHVNYRTMDPEQMWGNHPYADNRRKIIQECIDQLYTELQRRNINVG